MGLISLVFGVFCLWRIGPPAHIHRVNIILHLKEFDYLIVEHTRPPATAILRNKLHTLIEQAEAHQCAEAKAATRAIKIEQANKKLVAENKAIITENQALIVENAKA